MTAMALQALAPYGQDETVERALAWLKDQMQPDGTYTKVKPAPGQPPVDSQMAMYGYFQHGFETAHPAAPTRKAAAKPVQKAKHPTPHPHKPENKRFRGFLDSLFGHKK